MQNRTTFAAGRTLDVICLGRVAVDFYAQQIGARCFEPVPMGPGEGMTPGKSLAQPDLLGTRDDRALDRADVRDDGAALQVRGDGVELSDVGGRRGGEDHKIGNARHIGGAGRGIIERALLRRQRALGRLGGPSHHDDAVPAARLFHLTGNRAANRAEPNQAKGLGPHGLEGTRRPHIMEPHADRGGA